MKKVFLAAVSILSLVGCVNQVSPTKFTRVMGLGPATCVSDGTATVGLTGGTLDVAAGQPVFIVGANFEGVVPSTPGTTIKTGEVLEQSGSAIPIIDQVTVDYTLSRKLGGTLKQYTQNVLATPGTGASTYSLVVPINLISPDLGDILFNGLAVDESVELSALITGHGHVINSNQPFSTGSLTFPIHVVHSSTMTCTKFQRFTDSDADSSPDGCGYVGQVNTPFGVAPKPTCCDASIAAGTPLPGC